MSVVIAIKDKNKVYMGCDKQVSSGGNKNNLGGQCQKVWHYNGLPDIVIGGVGSLRDIQIIQTTPDLIDVPTLVLGQINYQYLVQNFFTKEYEILKDKNRIAKSEGDYVNFTNCALLLAFEDKMYHIDQEGSVLESDDFLVIGSGADVATGVLENNKTKKPEVRIKEAIKACAENTLYVNNDIYITDTKSEK